MEGQLTQREDKAGICGYKSEHRVKTQTVFGSRTLIHLVFTTYLYFESASSRQFYSFCPHSLTAFHPNEDNQLKRREISPPSVQ